MLVRAWRSNRVFAAGFLAALSAAGLGLSCAQDRDDTQQPIQSSMGAETEPATSSSPPRPTPVPANSSTSAAANDPGDTTSPAPTASGWIEVGSGIDSFAPFTNELPLELGPQGALMVTLPLRGADFPIAPPGQGFDHPDTPLLTVWVDLEGIDGPHPSGHFARFADYPVPFERVQAQTHAYEFTSVWLVLPQDRAPNELVGRSATLHAELACADGQQLVDTHELTVVDAT